MIHILFSLLFYPQGNDENSNQSKGQEGERQKSEEFEETGADWQEGGGKAQDTLTSKVCKLNISLRDLVLFVYFVYLVICFVVCCMSCVWCCCYTIALG